jgi:hypothetical protein
VAGERFDQILLDEVRSLARLVGGETLRDLPGNIRTLIDLCLMATGIAVCDADLDFKSHDSEDNTLVHDFMQMICPDRNVVCFQTSHPGPDHLKRSMCLYFMIANGWMTELGAACAAWHDDHSKRVAIVVGSKTQRRDVC